MKKFKKLIPAFCMLLVSAIMLGSSTFAWFSMNEKVTASGMTVTATSEQTYMIIGSGVLDAAGVQAGNATKVNAATGSAAILPSAHKDTVTNITTADTVGNWFYKYSNSPDNYGGTGNESAEVALTTDNFAKYVLVNTFSVTVAKGANGMNDIKVAECKITTAGDLAVKVLVATATAAEEFDQATAAGNTVLQASIADDSVMVVKIYIYLDGTNDQVYTNGIADLQSTTVEVSFTGTIAAKD